MGDEMQVGLENRPACVPLAVNGTDDEGVGFLQARPFQLSTEAVDQVASIEGVQLASRECVGGVD